MYFLQKFETLFLLPVDIYYNHLHFVQDDRGPLISV